MAAHVDLIAGCIDEVSVDVVDDQAVTGNVAVEFLLLTVFEDKKFVGSSSLDGVKAVVILFCIVKGNRTPGGECFWSSPAIHKDLCVGVMVRRGGAVVVPGSISHDVPVAGSVVGSVGGVVGVVKVHGPHDVAIFVTNYAYPGNSCSAGAS